MVYFKVRIFFFISLIRMKVEYKVLLFFFFLIILLFSSFSFEYTTSIQLLFLHMFLLVLYLSWLRYKPFYFISEILKFNIFISEHYAYLISFSMNLYIKFFKITFKFLNLFLVFVFASKQFLFSVAKMMYCSLIFVALSLY